MSTTWEEASRCPRDGQYQGKVVNRKTIHGGGQLLTLQCPEDNCSFHEDGWIVQTRPDGTIPDKMDPRDRDKRFYKTSMSSARKQMVTDALARQVELEQRPGSEV